MNEEKPFDIKEAKERIEKLLKEYRVKKDELEWIDDEWSIDEINDELERYAKEIKLLQAKVRKFEQSK